MVRLGEVRWDEVKLRSGEVNSIQASSIISTLTACRPNRLKAPSLARRCRSSGSTDEPSHWAAENIFLFFSFFHNQAESFGFLPARPRVPHMHDDSEPISSQGHNNTSPMPTTRQRRRTTQRPTETGGGDWGLKKNKHRSVFQSIN